MLRRNWNRADADGSRLAGATVRIIENDIQLMGRTVNAAVTLEFQRDGSVCYAHARTGHYNHLTSQVPLHRLRPVCDNETQ